MALLYRTAAPGAGGDESSEHGPQAARSEAAGADSGAHSAPGLVTCAISGRVSKPAGQTASRTRHVFRTGEECAAAAASLGSYAWGGREGPIPQIEVFPGVIRLTSPNLARREAVANRLRDAPPVVSETDVSGSRGEICGWSRKSRARMVATLAELDWAPMLLDGALPAMITLTYPAEWESVAGDGAAVKKHLNQLFRRYERAWGEALTGVWKLEFQSRGAPHFHILMCPPSGRAGAARRAEFAERVAAYEAGVRSTMPRWRPTVGDDLIFRDWISHVWADIVNHPDPEQRKKHLQAGTAVDFAEGDRARDPKRAAIYFGKHGTFSDKEYQHEVPEAWEKSGTSVGRFWGIRGLKRVKGVAMLSGEEMLYLGRILRKWSTRTRAWSPERGYYFRPQMKTVYRWRASDCWVSPAGVRTARKWVKRRTSIRVRRMTAATGAGFVVVNDGPAIATELARALKGFRAEMTVFPPGMRGPIKERLP